MESTSIKQNDNKSEAKQTSTVSVQKKGINLFQVIFLVIFIIALLFILNIFISIIGSRFF